VVKISNICWNVWQKFQLLTELCDCEKVSRKAHKKISEKNRKVFPSSRSDSTWNSRLGLRPLIRQRVLYRTTVGTYANVPSRAVQRSTRTATKLAECHREIFVTSRRNFSGRLSSTEKRTDKVFIFRWPQSLPSKLGKDTFKQSNFSHTTKESKLDLPFSLSHINFDRPGQNSILLTQKRT